MTVVLPADLVFRTWRSSDVEALVKYANNKSIWMNLRDSFPHPYTEADAEDWIGMNHVLVGPPVNFAIEVGGEAIGGVGLELLDDVLEDTANVGCWVAQPFWGRGIATAALEFITDYAFTNLPLERLQVGVFGWNQAAGRVLEKAGYLFEGCLRRAIVKDGRVGDLRFFGRIRST